MTKLICAHIFIVALFKMAHTLPNVILILADDQDLTLKGLTPMTKTISLIANQGATFENAYANSPLCCPSRSTILTGKYPHNLGVRNNSVEGNCASSYWQENHENKSLAAYLKRFSNYKTFYAGKYLNQYGTKHTGGVQKVPDGYDWWIGLKGNSVYYNYTLSINGTGKHFADQYLTDVIANYSLSFLEQIDETRPFFMMIAPPACHAPFTPAERHKTAFPNTTVFRSPSFNRSSKHKHWLMTMPPKSLPEDVSILDKIYPDRWRTLLAVDEMIEKITTRLEKAEILNNTFIIYTSDNGFHMGQFSQAWDKRQPYETDIKVPFLIRGPGVRKKGLVKYPIAFVDVAPTIMEMAGAHVPDDMDGVSFLRHLHDEMPFDRRILIEYFGESNDDIDASCDLVRDGNLQSCTVERWCKCQDSKNNTYACVLSMNSSEKIKFCQFYDDVNFTEIYDLNRDPNEFDNLHENPGFDSKYYKETLIRLLDCKGVDCQL